MRIISRYDDWIETVSERYSVPSALVKAILFQEMTMIDLGDKLADVIVRIGIFPKKDSSTGYGQIFGYVGLNAANFAVDAGLATYESLGLNAQHRLDAQSIEDVRLVWRKLNASPRANIELATLNIVSAAQEVVGRTDFGSFTDDEMKLVLTRYNANVRHVTPYGVQAFQRYQAFLRDDVEALLRTTWV